MKIFTHKYVITIYDNGGFCWKNHGWIKSDTFARFSWFQLVILMAILFALSMALINDI